MTYQTSKLESSNFLESCFVIVYILLGPVTPTQIFLSCGPELLYTIQYGIEKFWSIRQKNLSKFFFV